MKNKIPFPIAVLFDFDGVVVNSFSTHYAAWKDAYTELFQKDIPPFPHDKLAGKSPITISRFFCEVAEKPELADTLFNLKSVKLHNNTLPPEMLPGVKEIQTYLASKNIPHGIASNATRGYIGNSIKQLDLGFQTFLGVEDYKFPKPNPEPYLLLAKELGVSEKEFDKVWIFEDSITGTTAAKDAGMIPIGIGTQYSDEELKAAGSQIVFPTLLEAFNYLTGS